MLTLVLYQGTHVVHNMHTLLSDILVEWYVENTMLKLTLMLCYAVSTQ